MSDSTAPFITPVLFIGSDKYYGVALILTLTLNLILTSTLSMYTQSVLWLEPPSLSAKLKLDPIGVPQARVFFRDRCSLPDATADVMAGETEARSNAVIQQLLESRKILRHLRC